MGACQLVRKETKMEVVHLNQKQLATRWGVSEVTLGRWRSEGIGPKFLKLRGRVIYRQVDIEVYCRISSYLQTMANRGYNPLVAISMALSGELYAEPGE